MNPAFLARVTYAIDFLSTFTSTQLANSKLAQQTPPQEGAGKSSLGHQPNITVPSQSKNRQQGE
jgi:hypothetical protein